MELAGSLVVTGGAIVAAGTRIKSRKPQICAVLEPWDYTPDLTCSSFHKQRCMAGRAVLITKVSTAVDTLSLLTLTGSAKLNGKLVAAIFPK